MSNFLLEVKILLMITWTNIICPFIYSSAVFKISVYSFPFYMAQSGICLKMCYSTSCTNIKTSCTNIKTPYFIFTSY